MKRARDGMTTRRASISRVSLPLLLAAPFLAAPALSGETVAGKNREGNQLFAQGRYAEAEKAYVEALAKVPSRPELIYNHGNSLIMQKKNDLALQQLRQAASKGGQGLQASAWYNSGNALYEMDRFQDAVQAYIQALRANPADRDAKHNLELALKKMEQQDRSGQGRPQDDDRGAKQQPRDQSGNRQADSKPAPESSSPQQESRDTADSQGNRQDGNLSKEQALQILEAIHNQELADQRKHLQRLKRSRPEGKDW